MNPYYDANVLYDAGDRAMNGSQFKYASKLYKLNQLLITQQNYRRHFKMELTIRKGV